MSRAPARDTITGSTTTRVMPSAWSREATVEMISRLTSMPSLAASTPMSVATASIWAATDSAGMTSTRVTPSVFWAVSAVIALVPWTQWNANVRRSAWMPAPPPLSEPAIVSAVATFLGCSILCCLS
jgi:hypothetical protein